MTAFGVFFMQLLCKGTHRHRLVKKGNEIVEWSSCLFLYRNVQLDTKNLSPLILQKTVPDFVVKRNALYAVFTICVPYNSVS